MQRKNILIAITGFALLLAGFKTCFTKVRLNEVGIRVANLGDGIDEENYGPGYHLVIPGLHKMYRMDSTVQTLHMSDNKEADFAPLRLVGKDQYATQFDITLLYRLKKGEANIVAKEVGRTPPQIKKRVKSKAEKVLWETLGNLKSQDFYNVALREKVRENAKVMLNNDLAKLHLELIDILIRSIKYDSELEALLVKKQILDQNRALTTEKALLEKELEKTQAIENETIAKVGVINEEMTQEVANIVADTDAAIARIEADAQFKADSAIATANQYQRTKVSEGELARTQAQAKGEKAINEAYLIQGGQAYITRQMVDNIEFGDIEVNTNLINPFDVEQFLEMLGLKNFK